MLAQFGQRLIPPVIPALRDQSRCSIQVAANLGDGEAGGRSRGNRKGRKGRKGKKGETRLHERAGKALEAELGAKPKRARKAK